MDKTERDCIARALSLLQLMEANRDSTSESNEAADLLARVLGVPAYRRDD